MNTSFEPRMMGLLDQAERDLEHFWNIQPLLSSSWQGPLSLTHAYIARVDWAVKNLLDTPPDDPSERPRWTQTRQSIYLRVGTLIVHRLQSPRISDRMSRLISLISTSTLSAQFTEIDLSLIARELFMDAPTLRGITGFLSLHRDFFHTLFSYHQYKTGFILDERGQHQLSIRLDEPLSDTFFDRHDQTGRLRDELTIERIGRTTIITIPNTIAREKYGDSMMSDEQRGRIVSFILRVARWDIPLWRKITLRGKPVIERPFWKLGLSSQI